MNHDPLYTAVELLKMNGNRFQRMDAPRLIRRLAIEKDWNIGDIKHLSRAGQFGHMIQYYLNREGQRNLNTATSGIYDFMGSTLENFEPAQNCETYKGHHLQNKHIDSALLANGNLQNVGRGAATLFQGPQLAIPTAAKAVPIAIIGYGAAGIIATFVLIKTGFHNITVFEKANEPLGIWRQKNVFQRSRNNPRRIELLGNTLEPAPGDGEEVKNFLEKMRLNNYVKQATVTEIQPGNLDHTLILAKGSDLHQKLSVDPEQKFPIVINCMGLGKPKELTDPSRMTTHATSGVQRWQQTLSREQINNKRFVFIGLGNSTAEMLRQVHTHMDGAQGTAVDYRILTHYPKDAIFNPDEYVPYGGQTYRVFRDLSQPNLVNFHGDLSEFRDDYFRALRTGKIISDVKHWDETSGSNTLTIQISNRKKKKRELAVVPSDQTYALLGYKQPVDDLIALGCEYDSKSECPYYDYDGEFIKRNPGDPRNRFHRGYFGFGSVLEGKHNPNAMVIPGMTFRIGDLIFGVIMRAMEVARPQF